MFLPVIAYQKEEEVMVMMERELFANWRMKNINGIKKHNI